MKKILLYLAGIIWFIALFSFIGYILSPMAAYVAIGIWLGCLVLLYIYAVRQFGFKYAWRVSLFLAGLIPDINEEIRQELIHKPKIK